jgi:hypothetical protein
LPNKLPPEAPAACPRRKGQLALASNKDKLYNFHQTIYVLPSQSAAIGTQRFVLAGLGLNCSTLAVFKNYIFQAAKI